MSTSASSSKPAAASGTSSTQVPEPSKTAYRNPVVEDDDDDDDLDDLDGMSAASPFFVWCWPNAHAADVLNSFNAPKSTLGKRSEPDRTAAALAGAGSSSSRSPAPAAGGAEAGGDIDDDEFQASLMDGMESLLRSLAVDHPPGPMPGATSGSPDKSGAAAAGDMSSEEEEKAFQRAVEMMLSGEGMEALGLDGKKGASPGPSTRAGGAAPATGGPAGKASFDDTIRRTMESLNAGGAGASNDGMPEDLAALLAQLSKDPSALDGLGEDDDELGGLLDSMMGQLMSKEVLEEPMTELAAKVS